MPINLAFMRQRARTQSSRSVLITYLVGGQNPQQETLSSKKNKLKLRCGGKRPIPALRDGGRKIGSLRPALSQDKLKTNLG